MKNLLFFIMISILLGICSCGSVYKPGDSTYTPRDIAIPNTASFKTSGQIWSFSGNYESNWGTLVLEQAGNIVTGTYSSNNTLSGTVNGNQLEGSWTHGASNESGKFYFIMSQDGKYLRGNWGKNMTEKWNMKRTDFPIPTALSFPVEI